MATYKSNIKLNSLIENVNNQSLLQLTKAVEKAWDTSAKAKLNTTYKDYSKAITSKVSLGSRPKAEVYLKGSWANKLEKGFPSYDMKPQLKNSKNAKKSIIEDTWYATLPFEFKTTNATGKTGKTMPRAVYNAARALPSWGKLDSSSTGGKSWGIYEGLTKTPTNDSNTRHKYTNFRTVSEKSPPEAFIHPGFEGVHIQEELIEQIPDTFQKLVSENLRYFK